MVKKILIVQNRIAEYRVEIFNLLNQNYDVTVLYSAGEKPENAKFNVIHIDNKKGKVFWKFKCNLGKLFSQFDVVILPMDIRQIDAVAEVFRRKAKIISWGIGVSASYKIPFDSKRSIIMEYVYIRNSTACLFYSEYAAAKYSKVLGERAFVANNTASVRRIDINKEKKHLLFIGSLYPQKRIDELLEAYKTAYSECSVIPQLVIVGDGTEYKRIQQFIYDNNLHEKIILRGEVYDEEVLSEIFSSSIACISPNQAGLSVLKSMGYGVPFVTHKDAITGGERLNIINGENGILFNTFSELKQIIIDSGCKKDKFLEYGKNAYRYYWENRTPQIMVNGFEVAIEYATNESER